MPWIQLPSPAQETRARLPNQTTTHAFFSDDPGITAGSSRLCANKDRMTIGKFLKGHPTLTDVKLQQIHPADLYMPNHPFSKPPATNPSGSLGVTCGFANQSSHSRNRESAPRHQSSARDFISLFCLIDIFASHNSRPIINRLMSKSKEIAKSSETAGGIASAEHIAKADFYGCLFNNQDSPLARLFEQFLNNRHGRVI